jgi:hypothetical protein
VIKVYTIKENTYNIPKFYKSTEKSSTNRTFQNLSLYPKRLASSGFSFINILWKSIQYAQETPPSLRFKFIFFIEKMKEMGKLIILIHLDDCSFSHHLCWVPFISCYFLTLGESILFFCSNPLLWEIAPCGLKKLHHFLFSIYL